MANPDELKGYADQAIAGVSDYISNPINDLGLLADGAEVLLGIFTNIETFGSQVGTTIAAKLNLAVSLANLANGIADLRAGEIGARNDVATALSSMMQSFAGFATAYGGALVAAGGAQAATGTAIVNVSSKFGYAGLMFNVGLLGSNLLTDEQAITMAENWNNLVNGVVQTAEAEAALLRLLIDPKFWEALAKGGKQALDDLRETLKDFLPTMQLPSMQLKPEDYKFGDGKIDPKAKSGNDAAKSYVLPPRRDPLTLDLDGDGLETTGVAATNPILFDHDGDGIKTGTGWVSSDDAFLVRDKNGNGTIDNGRELFGDSTIKSNGQTATDGFDALADLDSNADGMISSADAQFASLRLWRDLNQDGISQSNELFTLASQNISSIKIASVAHSQTLPNGNQIADLGTFTKTNGTVGEVGVVTGNLADVNLGSDTFHRSFTDVLDTTAVQNLPDMQGSGKVRDLREAATQSTTLQTLLTNYSAATTRTAQLAQIDQLLDAWADTGGLAETMSQRVAAMTGYTKADGTVIPYVLTSNNLSAEWQQKLHIIETFNGSYFYGLPGTSQATGALTGITIATPNASSTSVQISVNFNQTQLDLLQQSYDAIKSSVYQALVLQTRLKPMLDQINLVIDTNGINLDFSQLLTTFNQAISANAEAGLIGLIEFNFSTGSMLKDTGWSGRELMVQQLEFVQTPAVIEALKLGGAMVKGALGFIASGTTSDDVIIGDGLADNLSGGAGDDVVYGLAGNDVLYGGLGKDLLIGGTGDDTLQTSYGNDTYVFKKGDGNDKIVNYDYDSFSSGTVRFLDVKSTEIQGLSAVGTGLKISYSQNDSVTIEMPSIYANSVTTVNYFTFADGITLSTQELLNLYPIQLSSSNDDIRFNNNALNYYNLTVKAGIGNDTLGSVYGNNKLYGEAGNDYVYAYNGNNLLDGGSGNDYLRLLSTYPAFPNGNNTLVGGLGSDILDANGSTATYIFSKGDGNDLISETYNTVGNIQTIQFTNVNSTEITARLVGNDLIVNYGSLDRITISNQFSTNRGVDQFKFSNGVTWGVTEITNLVNSSVQGSSSNDSLTGSSNSEVIYGNAGNDTILGGLGNDVLDGGAGDDSLVGGVGDDTYVVDSVNDIVVESAGEGIDLVESSITYTLGSNVEHLILTGVSAIDGTGNALNNELFGNSSNNILDGGGGIDTLQGGDGNDTYIVDNVADVIIERQNFGTDTVLSSVSYALSDFVDNLTLTGTNAINATGNADVNVIIGNSGDNLIDGGAYSDTMIGGMGNDTYYVDSSYDQVIENANEGTDLVGIIGYSGSQYTLGANLENMILLERTDYLGNLAYVGRGNELNNIITGNSVANTLLGYAGDDTLDGGAGADTLIGDIGNDTYVIDNINDVVTENAGEGTDTVQSSITYSLTSLANVENLTLIGSAAINGTGDAQNNVIAGNSAANILDGGTGIDTLIGGSGNDTYVVDTTTDTITENLNEGTDTVQSSVTYSLTSLANIENITLTGTLAINATGNSLDNLLTGNSGANNLDGGLGNDTMTGGVGNDTYVIDNINDVVTENAGEGTDTVQSSITYSLASLANVENLTLTGSAAINATGNASDNTIMGNAATNTLDGGIGNDTLDGGLGSDTMIGGVGNDAYVIDNINDVITENAGEGTDQVNSSVSYILSSNVENLTLMGTLAINATGNNLDNVIIGNSAANNLNGGIGNDTLDGGLGIDTMVGGVGNDTYFVDNTSDVITENLNEGTDQVISSVSYNISASTGIENITLTGTTAYFVFGNALDNIITGNSNSNYIDGGIGNDTMAGGLGDDQYYVDATGDVVIESLNEGYDSTSSTVTYTLGANLEQLTLIGSNDINATGNIIDNVLAGNTGNNILDGGEGNDALNGDIGNDTMLGGIGNDTYNFYVGGGSDIIDNSATDNSIASDTLYIQGVLPTALILNRIVDDLFIKISTTDNITIKNYYATGVDNKIDQIQFDNGTTWNQATIESKVDIPTTGNDLLTGTAGNDIIHALAGNDTVFGGTGDDQLFGDAGNDVLNGEIGNDSLDGGTGVDTLIGGVGNDTYTIDVLTDVVTENLNEGTDLVKVAVTAAGGTYTLAANIENATLTNTVAYSLTGNALDNVLTGNTAANTLTGNDGNDTLNGLAGIDTMIGGLGNDTYTIDVTTDVVTENLNEGTDIVNVAITTAGGTYTLAANVENATLTNTAAFTLTGNALDNVLTGNTAANTLNGGDGNDTLNGLAGTDTMVGGLGNDTYTIDVTTDVVTEAASAGTDTVNVAVTTAGGTYTLAANVENALLTNTVAYNLTGNTLANTITGNAANNVIDGGTGNDTMIGGLGNDTYTIDVLTDVITENLNEGTDLVNVAVATAGGTYTLAANLENATLTNTVAYSLIGNALDNFLTGNAAANTLNGGAGNDTLNGLAGNDTMVGGLGNDTYTIDVTTDVITENLNEGTDLVNVAVTTAGGTYTLAANVENATLTNTVAYSLTGNALDNVLTGNTAANTLNGGDGNDTLNGLAGNDTMVGGLGNDIYTIDVTTDVVTEAASAGTDTVNVGIATASGTYTVAANVENAILTNTVAYNLTGNALANFLMGNAANNTLTDTAGGNDILQGLAGVDTLNDTVGNNLFDGGAGNDTMTGGTGREIFIGGTGNDTITTSTGFDVISFNKGDGADIINASTGADNTISLGGNFAYSDLSLTKSTNDLILKMGTTDQITLKDWYLTSPTNKSVINLQVIAEAIQGFTLGGADALRNNKIENFNFTNLVAAFDAAGATANWQLTDARLTAQLLAGSDTAAIGGDLAYQYGKNSNLTGMGTLNAQSVIAAASFGQTAQTLNNPTVWQAELVKLG